MRRRIRKWIIFQLRWLWYVRIRGWQVIEFGKGKAYHKFAFIKVKKKPRNGKTARGEPI